MKVALVHDWLLSVGGAEKVLKSFHKLFPEAPVYTLLYDKKFCDQFLPDARIIPSFLQKIPNIKKIYPWFKILMPLAIESFDFSGFDLVISSTHEFSHGIITRPDTKQISYYHSPARLLWDRTHEYVNDFSGRGRGKFKLSLIRLGQHFLRLWDYQASKRADVAVANSLHVAGRIRKYYGREAKVIYPPISFPMGSSGLRNRESSIFQPNQHDLGKIGTPYFLIVGQLFLHKNIDLAVEAFSRLPQEYKLVVIGNGPEYKNLESRIKKLGIGNVKLLGYVPEEELSYYYQNCLTYIICNEEDFGIAPVEAMLFGKPVLALKRGGATETVIEGITGEFFNQPTPDSLARAVKNIYQRAKNGYFSQAVIKKHAEKFSFDRFRNEILTIVTNMTKYSKTYNI